MRNEDLNLNLIWRTLRSAKPIKLSSYLLFETLLTHGRPQDLVA
jgi:hypothetical protein